MEDITYSFKIHDMPTSDGVEWLNYSYSQVTPLEANFDTTKWVKIMHENWSISFYFCAVYLVLVYGLRAWMKNRERFELRGLLVVWNLALAIFSIVGAMRSYPDLADTLQQVGFRSSVCICGYR